MTFQCCKCGQAFEPNQSQVRQHNYVCKPCRRAYHKVWVRKPRLVTVPQFERFQPVPESGCWLFDGAWSHGFGYGMLTVDGVCDTAHRHFYRKFKGEIPSGMFVCHTCDTPPCVNPDHLFLGTIHDNNDDCTRKGRHARGARNGQSILTADQVREIRLMPRRIRLQEIADRYGVSPAAVCLARAGKTWSHVL